MRAGGAAAHNNQIKKNVDKTDLRREDATTGSEIGKGFKHL